MTHSLLRHDVHPGRQLSENSSVSGISKTAFLALLDKLSFEEVCLESRYISDGEGTSVSRVKGLGARKAQGSPPRDPDISI